jgi:polyisoprenoid-binding protein YceI
VARSERSQPSQRPRKLLLAAFLGVAIVVVGIVVYLRYFYGDDAPPAFELSSAVFFVPVGRGKYQRRNRHRARVGSTLASLIVVATVGSVITAGGLAVGVAASAASKVKVKVGGTCTKTGAKSTVGATKLVCTKVGKKLLWTATSAAATPTGSAPATTAPPVTVADASPTSIKAGTDPAPAAVGGIEGTWKTTTGSAAGYRVRELFVGGVAKVDAVGRTEAVTGSLVLARSGASLVAQSISVSVDTTKIESDETRRDNRMRTTGLETNKFPSATFATTAPITLPENAEKGDAIKLTLPGKLTLHGVARDVQFESEARLKDGTVEIVGRLNIKLPDFGIEPPEIADFVKADDDGTIEFKLFLKRA